MLTLCVTTPTLPVEQGFAGFSEAAEGGAATHRRPLCTMLFPRSSGFDPPAIRWSDACRNALFAGARTVQRLLGASSFRSPRSVLQSQVSGMAVLSQRATRPRHDYGVVREE